MKKEMLYLIPAILLLSGCGKSVSISINTNKNESTISESNNINESKETEITRDNEQTGVEMFDATVYYKPKDGYEPPENVIPQIKTDNKNLDSVVERINSTWTNDYSNIQITRADSNVFSLLIDTVTFDNNNSIGISREISDSIPHSIGRNSEDEKNLAKVGANSSEKRSIEKNLIIIWYLEIPQQKSYHGF